MNIEHQERIKRCNEDFEKISKLTNKIDEKFKKIDVKEVKLLIFLFYAMFS